MRLPGIIRAKLSKDLATHYTIDKLDFSSIPRLLKDEFDQAITFRLDHELKMLVDLKNRKLTCVNGYNGDVVYSSTSRSTTCSRYLTLTQYRLIKSWFKSFDSTSQGIIEKALTAPYTAYLDNIHLIQSLMLSDLSQEKGRRIRRYFETTQFRELSNSMYVISLESSNRISVVSSHFVIELSLTNSNEVVFLDYHVLRPNFTLFDELEIARRFFSSI